MQFVDAETCNNRASNKDESNLMRKFNPVFKGIAHARKNFLYLPQPS